MLFQDNQPGAATIDINQLEQYGQLYHMTMHRHKQMATHFDLSKKQSTALASVAKGQTAGDIAEQTGLVERSIELRLQQGRKKLSARTTTEAVYKALAYGILPLQPGRDEFSGKTALTLYSQMPWPYRASHECQYGLE